MAKAKTNTAVVGADTEEVQVVQSTQSTQSPKINVDLDYMDSLPTKSAKIRYLASKGMKTGDIAKHLGILYQHARNVLITPLKSTGTTNSNSADVVLPPQPSDVVEPKTE